MKDPFEVIVIGLQVGDDRPGLTGEAEQLIGLHRLRQRHKPAITFGDFERDLLLEQPGLKRFGVAFHGEPEAIVALRGPAGRIKRVKLFDVMAGFRKSMTTQRGCGTGLVGKIVPISRPTPEPFGINADDGKPSGLDGALSSEGALGFNTLMVEKPPLLFPLLVAGT